MQDMTHTLLPATELPTQHQLKVLILDDSDFDRERLKRMIGKADDAIEVIGCSDLYEFELALESNVFDICLVDHNLKTASGIDAVKAIKASSGISDLPVVMISGCEDTATVVQSMNAGCVDYLSKQALTAQALHSTIFNAISSTFTDASFADDVRQSTSLVLNGIASECLSELKPRLSRMYRQINFIRSCHVQGLFPSPDTLNEIEEQCLIIWRFFDEIETYSAGLLDAKH